LLSVTILYTNVTDTSIISVIIEIRKGFIFEIFYLKAKVLKKEKTENFILQNI